jgi:hypothetical protein
MNSTMQSLTSIVSAFGVCSGFYCDNWISGHAAANPTQPHMWTENWNGWFQHWGETVPHRPVEDTMFAVARFVMRGGTFHNYYM